ncbi:hypothetical protein JOD20_002379, partial [Herpetosiphon giganteus]|nr:hypothetical protein [Herpetosiphon giganteus]
VLLWVWFRHHPVYQTEVVLYPLVERPCPPLNFQGEVVKIPSPQPLARGAGEGL